jgi:hypothetical protein
MRFENSSHHSRRPFGSHSWLAVATALILAPVLASLAGCSGREEEKLSEADLQMVHSNLLPTAPAPKHAVNADLDGKLVYLGSDFEPAVAEPGKQVRVTNYWKVIEAPGEGWRIFTHLEAPNHHGFVNDDHGAIAGKYPVEQWKAGEIVRDQRTITVPANWSASSMLIYVGAWKGQTRLSVKSGPSDGANRVLAATIPIKK